MGYEVPINLFSKQEKKNWLEIVVECFDELSQEQDYDLILKRALAALDGQQEPEIDQDVVREKRFDEYSSSSNPIKKIEGSVIGPSIFMNYAIKEYFELYMYY